MTDLNDMHPNERAAAMKGGMDGWGRWGSAIEHIRYSMQIDAKKLGKCHCGCGGKATHYGGANGVALAWGCELNIARWVKNG